MILAAIGNALTDDSLKDYVVDEAMEQNLKPAIEQQVFGSSWGRGGHHGGGHPGGGHPGD
jgi:hypothetical protein